MNKFDNTYIDVSDNSPSEIYKLAKKYSEVSGIEINSEDAESGCFDDDWEYLCCSLGGDKYYTGVYVTGEHLPDNPKQITEEDLDNHLKQQEQVMKTPQELPEEFIITNADNLAVRQWLKDLGYTWSSGDDLTEWRTDMSTLVINGKGQFCWDILEHVRVHYPHLPIITPNIGVTGFDITYPTPEKSVKEVEIENMKKQIFEMQESLKKLESEG